MERTPVLVRLGVMRLLTPEERLYRSIFPGRVARLFRNLVGFAGERLRDDQDETSFWARVTIAADTAFTYIVGQTWSWRKVPHRT